MSMKYSFLMPYHMRAHQLSATLSSFLRLYHRDDYEILIGEDHKNIIDVEEHRALHSVVENYKQQNPSITVIPTGGFNCWNPSKAFNDLARIAVGKYLLITNPECLHETNILAGLDQAFGYNPEQYIVCACRIPTGQWYQHSVHRPVKVHFCSALSKDLYDKLGGFDEEYSRGVCFEDDDFRNMIVHNDIPIQERDDLVVLHQNHSKSKPPNYRELHTRNRTYFNQKWGDSAFRTEQITVEPHQAKTG